jgi:hypothetical protein
MAAEILGALWELIAKRYEKRDKYELSDFLFANHLFRGLDEDDVEFLSAYREDILTLLSDDAERGILIDSMVDATRMFTWQRNQYLALPVGTETLLTSIYDALVVRSTHALAFAADRTELARSMHAVIDAHHERLHRFFSSVCPTDADGMPTGAFLRSVPCEEYTAETQLRLLALDLADMQQPVLDLGCGSEGGLVRFLLDADIPTVGCDRLAPHEAGFLRMDWTQAPMEELHWGTVLAHQSFSLHFLFHHRHQTGQEQKYAQFFMRILMSLRPGGRFCYTPGLPFFEEVLEREDTFRIRRYPHEAANSQVLRDVALAVHIQR